MLRFFSLPNRFPSDDNCHCYKRRIFRNGLFTSFYLLYNSRVCNAFRSICLPHKTLAVYFSCKVIITHISSLTASLSTYLKCFVFVYFAQPWVRSFVTPSTCAMKNIYMYIYVYAYICMHRGKLNPPLKG